MNLSSYRLHWIQLNSFDSVSPFSSTLLALFSSVNILSRWSNSSCSIINVVKIYSLLLNQKRKYIISIRKVEYSHHLCVIFILGKINRYGFGWETWFNSVNIQTPWLLKWFMENILHAHVYLYFTWQIRKCWTWQIWMTRRIVCPNDDIDAGGDPLIIRFSYSYYHVV